MRCGWFAAPSLLGARCARTSPYARTGWQPLTTWDDEGGTGKPSEDTHRGGECPSLAMRLQTHGEPDARAFHRLLQAAVGLKAKDYPPEAYGTARRCRVRQIGQRRDGNLCPGPLPFSKKTTFQRALGVGPKSPVKRTGLERSRAEAQRLISSNAFPDDSRRGRRPRRIIAPEPPPQTERECSRDLQPAPYPASPE
jgi:hypothetical protein